MENVHLLLTMDAAQEYEELSDNTLDFVPDTLYTDAYGSTFTSRPMSKFNYFGGRPLMGANHTWPVCPKHGPLVFLWSAEDLVDGTVVQCYVCCNVLLASKQDDQREDRIGLIEPNFKCGTGGNIQLCGRNRIGYLCRRLVEGTVVHERRPPNASTPELPRISFDWKKIRLLDAQAVDARPMMFNSFYGLDDGRVIHADVAAEAEMESKSVAQKHFLLHRTKGLAEQYENLDEQFGHFVMVWGGGDVPFYADRNPKHLHLNYDLVMKEVN